MIADVLDVSAGLRERILADDYRTRFQMGLQQLENGR